MNPKLLNVKKGPWRDGSRGYPVRTLTVDGWYVFEEVKIGKGQFQLGEAGVILWPIVSHSYEVARCAKEATADYLRALLLTGQDTIHDYWDCNCETDYITPKSMQRCPACGAKFCEVDYADSTLSELAQAVTE